MTLLADVKLALRLTSTAYDNEVQDIIDACADQLRLAGVSAAAVEAAGPAPAVKRAFILYAKAQFGMDNPDAEKYMASYHLVTTALALSAEYGQPTCTGISGTIAAGSDELTVGDVTAIVVDAWLSIAGAGADGALLLAQVSGIADSVVTISRLAATAVTDAAVTVL